MRKTGRVRMEAGGTVLFPVLQRNDECVNFEGILQTFFFFYHFLLYISDLGICKTAAWSSSLNST